MVSIKTDGENIFGLFDGPYVPTGWTEYTGPMPGEPPFERYTLVLRDGVLVYVEEEAPTPTPSKAEQESRRASVYRDRVDPITCEIQRLRDMGGTEKEISEAEQRRAEAVQAIVEEFPYPASAGSADKTAQDKPLPTLY